MGGTRDTTETLEGGKELTGVELDVRCGEDVAKSLERDSPSIVAGVEVVGPMETVSAPGSGAVVAPGVGKLSSCWLLMSNIPGGTMTTLSSESLAKEISTSSASSLS